MVVGLRGVGGLPAAQSDVADVGVVRHGPATAVGCVAGQPPLGTDRGGPTVYRLAGEGV